jgi:hypothetical protein
MFSDVSVHVAYEGLQKLPLATGGAGLNKIEKQPPNKFGGYVLIFCIYSYTLIRIYSFYFFGYPTV